jgi:hypothetical protein
VKAFDTFHRFVPKEWQVDADDDDNYYDDNSATKNY